MARRRSLRSTGRGLVGGQVPCPHTAVAAAGDRGGWSGVAASAGSGTRIDGMSHIGVRALVECGASDGRKMAGHRGPEVTLTIYASFRFGPGSVGKAAAWLSLRHVPRAAGGQHRSYRSRVRRAGRNGNRRAEPVVRKIVIAVVVTVAAVAGPGLPAGAAGAAARAPEVGGVGAGGAVTHARPLVRAGSPGMSRALAGSGDQLWRSRFHPAFPGCSDYHAKAVAVSPGGDAVFVTGYCDFGEDFFTVAYNAATGARLWASRYNGPGNGNDVAVAVA